MVGVVRVVDAVIVVGVVDVVAVVDTCVVLTVSVVFDVFKFCIGVVAVVLSIFVVAVDCDGVAEALEDADVTVVVLTVVVNVVVVRLHV